MSKFKFLTTPEFHPQAKKAPFFKNTFVKECVSAKENLIERHSFEEIKRFARKTNRVIITKNRDALVPGNNPVKTIIFLNGNLTLGEVQEKLNKNKDRIYKWLLQKNSMIFKII